MSEEPVEGNFGAASEPAQFASAEPKAPTLPTSALAAGRPANLGPPVGTMLRPSDTVTTAAPVSPPPDSVAPPRRPAVNVTPAVRSNVRPEAPGSPVNGGGVPASPAFRPGSDLSTP